MIGVSKGLKGAAIDMGMSLQAPKTVLESFKCQGPLVSITVFVLTVTLLCQTKQNSQADIVDELMPDGVPSRMLKLSPDKQAEAVNRLEVAQKQATGKRAQQIAFLLAALGFEYEKNRDYLVQELKLCSSPSVKGRCDETTGALLIVLYQGGHQEILRPLLLAGMKSDAALSEALGTFYSDVLTQNPPEFLHAIRGLPAASQKRLCSLAGSGDGSGMSSGALQATRKHLKAIGNEIALRCLRAVEVSNRCQVKRQSQ